MLKFLNKKKDNKGFSLVELIIVVAIMAILVGLLAPQYIKYVEKSRKSADASNLDEMVQAVQVYAADADVSSDDSKSTNLAEGDYTITIKGSGVTTTGDGITTAIESNVPDYTNIKLKSNKWGNGSNGITANIHVDADGGTTVTYTPAKLATFMNKKASN